MLPVVVLGAALVVYIAGYASKPGPQEAPLGVLTGQVDDLSMIPSANAQDNRSEVMPFDFNSPNDPPLAPDAPPVLYWNIDDIQKVHTDLAEKASKALKEAGRGSSQSFRRRARACIDAQFQHLHALPRPPRAASPELDQGQQRFG
jgi:hypothetical protein